MKIETQILGKLWNETFVLPSSLANELGIERTTCLAAIQNLQKIGYDIENHPQYGWRLCNCEDGLHAFEIEARLPQNEFSKNLTILPQTTSTNDLALEAGFQGAPQGTAFVAETQTAGRGRHGRVWESSQPIGLWLTCLFRPPWLATAVQRLTIISSVAVSQTVEKITGQACQIKWPNDLLFKEQKLCGILTETRVDKNQQRFAIVGIGLNVNQVPEIFPKNLRAISLRTIMGAEQRRADVLVTLLDTLNSLYQKPFDEVLETWRQQCISFGQMARIVDGTQEWTGQMVDVDTSGTLHLRLSNGHIQPIQSGEIFLLSHANNY